MDPSEGLSARNGLVVLQGYEVGLVNQQPRVAVKLLCRNVENERRGLERTNCVELRFERNKPGVRYGHNDLF